jgi:hypothetical protein
MRMRNAVLLASAALLLPGCAAAKRGAEDAAVVATLPIHLVTTPAGFFADAWGKDPLSTAARAPVLLPLYVAGDVFFTGVSAVDLALTPLYAPFPVKSPGLFYLRRFPPTLERGVGENAGTAAAGVLVLLAPLGALFLICTGHGEWTPTQTQEQPPQPYP